MKPVKTIDPRMKHGFSVVPLLLYKRTTNKETKKRDAHIVKLIRTAHNVITATTTKRRKCIG